MPSVKSAEKRARTNLKRRERNRRDRSRMRTAIKKVRQAPSAGSAREALVGAESLLDRLAGRGVIHGNAAARHKSRLHAYVAKLEA
ncbi:MAG: 30S ribosomal protein S20 [Gemmatimonadetes bacterium]|nr:30S ribosomal protein S20 [Gemmatimonadota bacterium]